MRPATWNVLSIVVLLATCCLTGVYGLILMDSNSALNLFPPSTLVPTVAGIEFFTVTPSWVPRSLPPTWTPASGGGGQSAPQETQPPPGNKPTSTIEPTQTGFVIASFTPSATITDTPTLTPTNTLTPLPTPTSTKTRVPTITRTSTPAATNTPRPTITSTPTP